MRRFAALIALAGCGSDAPAMPDAAAPPPDASGFTTAPHPALPQVPDHGGRVLGHIQLVTITFAGYAYEHEVQAFGDWIATSSWLAGLCTDYRCGTGAHVGKVVLPGPAPAVANESDIESLLLAAIHGGQLPAPPSPANDYLYMIYFPSTTQVNAPGLSGGCQTAGGYHFAVHDGATAWSFAAIPDCSASTPYWTPLESIEEAASHELIEAVTDADPYAPAFWLDDPANPWFQTYGEVGDLCVTTVAHDGAFIATGAWSNSAAAAGGNPCQPAGDAPYFNTSAPPSVAVAAGGTATFTATGWSTAARGPWHVFVTQGYQGAFDPKPALSATAVNNGEGITVTVSAPPNTPSGISGSLIMYSYDNAAGPFSLWPVLVEVE